MEDKCEKTLIRLAKEGEYNDATKCRNWAPRKCQWVNRANQIGALLDAVRLGNNSNEFPWNDRVVVTKTGPYVATTRATLARVAVVIYGVSRNDGWLLYEIDPTTFEQLSVPSQSGSHTENYRLVGRRDIIDNGERILLG